jgi:hypothetical protein
MKKRETKYWPQPTILRLGKRWKNIWSIKSSQIPRSWLSFFESVQGQSRTGNRMELFPISRFVDRSDTTFLLSWKLWNSKTVKA